MAAAARPIPTQHEVEAAFAEFMQRENYLPGPIQADTKDFVRFDAPGDKQGKRNGYYKLKTGRWPVGWFGDWKTGHHLDWFFHDPNAGELTKEERASIKREQARLKQEAQVAIETRQAEIAEDASDKWKRSIADVDGHPYLVKKGIDIARSVRVYTAKDGAQLLAVPMYAFDMNGNPQLQNLQLINADGEKRFLKGGRKQGCFFSLKGDTSTIVVCEGYSTGVKIWQASGLSVVVAFDAGNLIEVVKTFARHRQLARLLIAGDDDAIAPDDWHLKSNGRPWVNHGAKKAEAAAKAVGCRWILPHFIKGQARTRTDFDDLQREEGIEAVQRQIIGAFQSVDPTDAEPGATVVHLDVVQDETWRSEIPRTSSGNVDGTNVYGVALYIANHRLLRGRLRFNLLSKQVELDDNELQDFHVAEYRRLMHTENFKAKKSDVIDEMDADARRNTFDPLTDYLAGLKWDAKPRLETWLTTYAGVDDSLYSRTVGSKFLIGAVARALDPGCKNDTMIVLEGDQGIGKSTLLRYLFGDRFFVDHLPDFHSKDSFQQLQGAWCVEVAELSALGKADVKDVKQFLSRLVDKFRPPYGHNPIQVPRRTVFAGTVNPEEGAGYLRDPTGARRFWPVLCGSIDLGAMIRERDQLWAEAVMLYRQGIKWHLESNEAITAASEEQAKRREVDPWEDVIRSWSEVSSRKQATIAEVLNEAIKIPAEKQESRHTRKVGSALRAMGWSSRMVRYGDKTALTFYAPGHRPDEDDAVRF